ncbi:TonB-dependent receptor domain-containing protein [uncultured Hyphomonas sp.]|uniref:TonB-dependent receptor n=1 Tax=uncultured Hyphomonas sp. TaxID=225298 RepID=UPI002AAA6684|nr:TonB-dependent receptor [uncultured Hyphomonas sp.]
MLLLSCVLTGTALPVLAEPAETAEVESRQDAVIVHGRGLELIGAAGAASEGVVGYADFEDRPLSRVGELVEVIPGAVATQHSGEGKANQYFLRGFNLDHGTDFSASFDGVPVNLRTHGHGQGYLDLNFVIPEIVERVDYWKGPYRAFNGDFSAAGAAGYQTYDALDRPFAEISAGENGYLRGVTAGAIEAGPNTRLLLAAETLAYDGPWDLDQDLQKLNGFAKLVHETGNWRLEGSASAYDSSWNATDQVPLRAVQSGQIGRFGVIDPDLGGETHRYGLTGHARYSHADGAETNLLAYFVDYELSLFSDFTYFLEDPVNGDEFEQFDSRSYYGGSVRHQRDLSDRVKLRAGLDVRQDDISDVGLFRTAARERLSSVRQDSVTETSLSGWAEAEIAFSDRLRLTAGLRGDYYEADVDARSLPANSGTADDTLLSPSLALAWRAADGVELYANYGQGLHSNDVRGATITIDPASGDPASQVPILVRAEGGEIGARLERGSFKASVALFTLDLDSELVFVGDAGTTEANDASSRTGIETNLFWQPTEWLVADLSAAWTDSEFDIPGNATEIPGAVKEVIGGGFVARFDPWTFSGRLRHFGGAPLVEDGSLDADDTSVVNFAANVDWRNATFGIELLNAFNSKDEDITYFYESQLAGEGSPVEDIHFHPVEPRQLRFSVRYNF